MELVIEEKIEEVKETVELVVEEKSEEIKKIDIQIFNIDELKQCLEFIKETCIVPFIKKADFDTITKVIICYRSINTSLETLEISQKVILEMK